MSKILNSAGKKEASIGEDGVVRSASGVKIGRVLMSRDVLNNSGEKVGHFAANGYVYNYDDNHIGTVHSDGRIYDYDNHYMGKVVGEHIESGGAALLLLVIE